MTVGFVLCFTSSTVLGNKERKAAEDEEFERKSNMKRTFKSASDNYLINN